MIQAEKDHPNQKLKEHKCLKLVFLAHVFFIILVEHPINISNPSLGLILLSSFKTITRQHQKLFEGF